ncbi:MAG: CHAD domain-containing protein [Alphaproteobacteria bacterium]|nr:CHAD domain-containing protein [Alphaproteobacteria bacterium]MBU1513625.1 CHAD domain-containing protein [Alphaproteobacteria bacterium]MBU2094730.1 CHAD domain-containing protein [Alphaproteobacteria bacterium]MBU2150201.1 CHAD domain-containing protein [Alphaproteobacteria bacterium]MBU2309270.1 CHAD domain-containing protein [Alphaproteobacteria bacterium]
MLARNPAKAAPELEIKFQLGAGAVEALQGEAFPLEKAVISQLHAVYFDTPTHALRDGGFSLRVRRKGDTYIQTLKHRAGGGLFERDEWEHQVPGADLDLAALVCTPAQAAIGEAALSPAFTVEVERRTHIWTKGQTRIEVVFDTGLIIAGDRQDTICEMELELLAGTPQTLFDLARELQSKAPLTLAFESKAQRGYRLAGHDGVAALRAQASAVDAETTGETAFQLIARDALIQIAGNARLLQRAHNPDVLHQMRVGLRRLRAALSVFKDMLDAEGLNAARRDTQWLAGELSEARDIDVFLQRAATPDEIEESPGRAAFFRALRIAQAEAYETALAAVRSDRFRGLLFNLAEWIEVGGWLRLANDAQRTLREGSAAALAAPVLDRLDRRLRRGSRKFKQIDAEGRHDLRKQAKKLRYAAAFFGEAFPRHPKRRQRFVTALKALQDQLGELNDMAVARAVAMRAVGRRSGELAFAAGLEVGRLTGDEDVVIETANKALKAFRRMKPFWSSSEGRNEDLNLSRPRLRTV